MLTVLVLSGGSAPLPSFKGLPAILDKFLGLWTQPQLLLLSSHGLPLCVSSSSLLSLVSHCRWISGSYLSFPLTPLPHLALLTPDGFPPS